MPKKRIIIVTAYMLACCIIVGAYSFVVIKEGKKSPQTSEENKKHKEQTDLDESNERDVLKDKLVEDLDDFLSSDYSEVSMNSRSNDKSSFSSVTMLKEGENTLYNVSIDYDRGDSHIYIMSDNNYAYVKSNIDSNWERTQNKEDLTKGIMLNSKYISYVSLIYAALDAGLAYEYSPRDSGYVIKIEKDDAADLDFRSINTKIKNIDKLRIYENYLISNEQLFKFYDEELGIVRKRYTLSLEKNETFFVEVLKNSKKDELERISSLGRRKIKDSTKEKDSFLSLFERTKSKYRGN